jgi:hypothetical protein
MSKIRHIVTGHSPQLGRRVQHVILAMDDADAEARFQRAHKGAKDIIIIGRTVPNAHLAAGQG